MAVNMEAAAAAKWVSEVRTEISAVNKTLGDVTQACKGDPRDDIIVQLTKKTGEMLNETWDTASKAYENAWKNVEDGIRAVVNAGKEATDAFEQFMAKYR